MDPFEKQFPELPSAVFEVSRVALLLYLCLKEAANRGSVCKRARYTGALAGIRKEEYDKAVAELEHAGLIRLEKWDDDYGPTTAAILLQAPTVLHDRLSANEWARIRSFVFDRDNFTCQYCGASDIELECDHIVALAAGGTNEIGNLITACGKCNASKGMKQLAEWKGRRAS